MENSKAKWYFAVVLGLSLLLFSFRLGERPFRNPDEGRYAEIAREMVLSKQWIEPKLYGVDYLSKPPLFYWLLAASFKTFGFNEGAARAIPAVFGFLGVGLVYFFVRRYFGARSAVFSALILATNIWYLQISRYVITDAVFSFFLVGALFSFYAFLRDDRRIFLFLFYIFSALAFLSKGIAGVALPALVVLVYFLVLRRVHEGVARSLSPGGAMLFFLIVFPWLFAITVRRPSFPETFLFHEHLSRYLSASFEHQEPWFFYFALLPLVFFPWSLFAPVLKRAGTAGHGFTKDRRLYFWVTFVVVLLFYSISRSKLATYLMPLLAPGAVLLGEAWARWTEAGKTETNMRPSVWVTLLLSGALLGSAVVVILSPVIGFRFPHKIPAELRPVAFSGLLLVIAGFGSVIYCLLKNKRSAAFYSMVAFLSAASVLVAYSMEGLNSFYTTKPFAEILRPRLKQGEEVFVYGSPGAFYDFMFYLDYPVKLVGLEGELELAKGNPENEAVAVSAGEFQKLLSDGRRSFYCLMRRSDFLGMDAKIREKLKVLSQDRRKVLVSRIL